MRTWRVDDLAASIRGILQVFWSARLGLWVVPLAEASDKDRLEGNRPFRLEPHHRDTFEEGLTALDLEL